MSMEWLAKALPPVLVTISRSLESKDIRLTESMKQVEDWLSCCRKVHPPRDHARYEFLAEQKLARLEAQDAAREEKASQLPGWRWYTLWYPPSTPYWGGPRPWVRRAFPKNYALVGTALRNLGSAIQWPFFVMCWLSTLSLMCSGALLVSLILKGPPLSQMGVAIIGILNSLIYAHLFSGFARINEGRRPRRRHV